MRIITSYGAVWCVGSTAQHITPRGICQGYKASARIPRLPKEPYFNIKNHIKPSPKNILAIIGTVLLILVIGTLLFWLKTKPLNSNIANADTRTLLTPNNLEYHYNKNSPEGNCQEEFNQDQPSTTVWYTSREKGIEFDVPYNPNWGSTNFRLGPYWEYDNQIAFGAMTAFERCSWIRTYTLHIRLAHDADTVIRDILASDPPELIPVAPTTLEINGLTVVKYATSGLCSYPAFQVIGKKYNYEFAPVCSTNIETDFEYLEKIVKTVKLRE